MERNYKAFISYRHLPLDLEYAKKLHTTIERYSIPREYRKNGEKKLGLVFRDKDELPITNNLTNNLRMALDHSEYLILICSPQTKESIWVLEEIEYFIKTHDRDHVLVLIVDGDPGSVFPKELTEIFDDEGNFIQHIEPLAANIAAPSAAKRKRLFSVEVLRILATLIGCPFDALYRREQRRKLRALAVSSAAVLAVAGGFIGMLVNRNAQIALQLSETQRKESELMARLSQISLAEDNVTEAIRQAVEALPVSGEKPYVLEAESALQNALSPYLSGAFTETASIEQESTIERFGISPEGDYVYTRDLYGVVHMYDTMTGQLLWSRSNVGDSCDFSREGYLITRPANTLDCIQALDPQDQEVVWETPCDDPIRILDNGVLFASGDSGALSAYSSADGSLLGEAVIPEECSFATICAPAGSPDQRFAAFEVATSSIHEVLVWDIDTGEVTPVGEIESTMFGLHSFLFTSDSSFMSAQEAYENYIPVCLYEYADGEWEKTVDHNIDKKYDPMKTEDSAHIGGAPQLFRMGDRVGLTSRRYFMSLDPSALEAEYKEMQQDLILGHSVLADGVAAMVMKHNTVSLCTEKGVTSQQKQKYFVTNEDISAGCCGGASLDELVFAVKQKKHPNRLTLIRWKEDPSAVVIGDFCPDQNLRYMLSPDGTQEAWFGFDSDADEVIAVMKNRAGEFQEYRISAEETEADRNLVDYVYLGDGLLRGREDTFDFYQGISYATNTHSLPEGTFAVGQNGYALVREVEYDDNWDRHYHYQSYLIAAKEYLPFSDIDYDIIPEMFSPRACDIAFAERKSYLAYVTDHRSLAIRDLSADTIVCEIAEDIYTPEITWMTFLDEDRLLITLGESGRVRFYDTESGKQLSTASFEEHNVSYNKNAYYHAQIDRERNRLFIFHTDPRYTQSAGYMFTLDQLQPFEILMGAEGYREETGELIMKNFMGDIYAIPLLSGEELRERGQQILDAAQAPEAEMEE